MGNIRNQILAVAAIVGFVPAWLWYQIGLKGIRSADSVEIVEKLSLYEKVISDPSFVCTENEAQNWVSVVQNNEAVIQSYSGILFEISTLVYLVGFVTFIWLIYIYYQIKGVQD